MAENREKEICISPKSKRNQIFLLSVGALFLVLSMLINLIFAGDFTFLLVLPLFISFTAFLIGLLKLLEPPLTYRLTPYTLHFIHRTGSWKLNWQDIARIGKVTAMQKGAYTQLAFIGVRLHTLEGIAKHISPRLANKLLHEQQELIVLAIRNGDISGKEGLINFEPFSLNGELYTGPVAAWLYRCNQLRTAYGYHLFLPENSFDRDLTDFLDLLRECSEYSRVYQVNSQ